MHIDMAEKIELWEIDKLTPYDKNARTHSEEQVRKIAASMSQFGFTNPILVDSNTGIIAGHGRLQAAKLLGLTKVPVIILDHLNEQQKRAYVLADNRLALDAGWDTELLHQELQWLDDQEFDLELTGFSDDELKNILEIPEPEPPPQQKAKDSMIIFRTFKLSTEQNDILNDALSFTKKNEDCSDEINDSEIGCQLAALAKSYMIDK